MMMVMTTSSHTSLRVLSSLEGSPACVCVCERLVRAHLTLLDVRDHMSETAVTSEPALFKVSSSTATQLKAFSGKEHDGNRSE